jgi:hypothetical protein
MSLDLKEARALASDRAMPRKETRRSGRSLFASVALVLALLGSGCGSDDCSGVLTFNVNEAECESLADRFGCSSFEIDGPRCGLFGCASCGDLNDGP